MNGDAALDNRGASKPRSRLGLWTRRLGPFAVSAAILAFYLRDFGWTALVRIIAHVNVPLATAAVVIPQLVNWYFGALVIQRTIVWFHGPISLSSLFWMRGASYILAFVNSALGGGSLLFYQQRRGQLSWTKLLGIVLFRVGLWLWGICLIMIPLTIIVHLNGIDQRMRINFYLWWALLIFGALWFFEAWHNWHHGGYWGLSRLVARDRDNEFWTAFRRSTPRLWLTFWALSLPQVFSTILGYHLLNQAFGIDAPLVESLVVLPLALLIMDLPVAFAGFGTATLAWVTFFGDYGSTENVTALTLFMPMARMLTRALIGALSLRPALGEIEFLLASLRPAPAQRNPTGQG